MRGAVFLTTRPEAGRALLDELRLRYPDCKWRVHVRDDDRAEISDALDDCEVRSDKPAGGKLAFVRALRRERYDLAVVAWHDDGRQHPMKLVALVCGARQKIAYDEQLRPIPLSPWRCVGWIRHALRRLATAKLRPATALRLVGAIYRRTVGLAIGALWTLSCFWGWRVRRRPVR